MINKINSVKLINISFRQTTGVLFLFLVTLSHTTYVCFPVCSTAYDVLKKRRAVTTSPRPPTCSRPTACIRTAPEVHVELLQYYSSSSEFNDENERFFERRKQQREALVYTTKTRRRRRKNTQYSFPKVRYNSRVQEGPRCMKTKWVPTIR